MIVLGFVMTALAGGIEAVMDKLQFHYYETFFLGKNDQFWNPKISWKNKYKADEVTPRFLGSTTIFVFVTDGWHLMKFLRNLFIWTGFGLMLCGDLWDVAYVVASRGLFGAVFSLTFKRL
jgi:hypothetical protein